MLSDIRVPGTFGSVTLLARSLELCETEGVCN